MSHRMLHRNLRHLQHLDACAENSTDQHSSCIARRLLKKAIALRRSITVQTSPHGTIPSKRYRTFLSTALIVFTVLSIALLPNHRITLAADDHPLASSTFD